MTLLTPIPSADIIRCYQCGREGHVQGPSGLSEVIGEPGWRITPSDRYKPSGRHTCPNCIRAAGVWTTYCADECCVCDEYWTCDEDMGCDYCDGIDPRPDAEDPEFCIVAPPYFTQNAVLGRAVQEGVKSACGNKAEGVSYLCRVNDHYAYGHDFR